MSQLDIQPPEAQDLIDELKVLRRSGITKLAQLDMPALSQAVRAAGRVEQNEVLGPYMIERQIRDAVVRIGGDLQDSAALLFGLEDGGRSGKPSQLREEAARLIGTREDGVSVEHFRKHYEPTIIENIALLILGEIHDHRLRLAKLKADIRTPVGSRLAVEWLNRFEAMYAIWSPITGVAGDLTAYRSTLLEVNRPYDEPGNPNDPSDEGYSQEIQAAGYVTDAFAHYARFLVELNTFERRFGGLWLLPEAQAETDLSYAVHHVVLASPHNERDDSYVRTVMHEAKEYEHFAFLNLAKTKDTAMEIHTEWQQWSNKCKCQWELGKRQGRELFPTHRNHPDIDPTCPMHRLIAACSDYCLILDDAWDQIADWYHGIPINRKPGKTSEEVYSNTATTQE